MKIKIFFWLIFLLGLISGYSQNEFYNPLDVKTLKIYFHDSNWHYLLDSLFEAGTEERIKAHIEIDGTMLYNVGIRYKGYSSVNPGLYKNPLNIKLDYTVNNQEYMGINKIKLSNVIHDPSFVREVLSYEIARQYMPASQAGYAMVYVNDTVLGLYTNVEAVNKDFTDTHFYSRSHAFFKGNPEHLVYPSGSNSNLQYYSNDTTNYIPYYSREADDSYAWLELLEMIDVLNNNSDSISEVLNIDRALWMLAFDYALVNLDSYIAYAQNYYLYKDNAGRFNPVLWDLNMSFGSFRFSDGSYSALTGGITVEGAKTVDPLGLMSFSISPRPLITVLLSNERYKKMYLAHIRTIMEENFDTGDYLLRAQELQTAIDTYVQQDTNKFYSYTDFVDNLQSTVGGTSGMLQYPGIVDLVTDRSIYLHNYYGVDGNPVITNETAYPQQAAPGASATFIVRAEKADSCFFAYRIGVDDIFQYEVMYDDGLHGDGVANDSVFGVEKVVEPGFQYFFYAENDSTGAFLPARAEFEWYSYPIDPVSMNQGDLVINEIMAYNVTCCPDNYGENDDWIELYNNSTNTIDLYGFYLSDKSNEKYKWSLPDTSIAGNGYLIIWADSDPEQVGLHTNFSFLRTEALYLSNRDFSLIDSVTFQDQIGNLSYGRYPNGTGPYTVLTPTQGSPNSVFSVDEIDQDDLLKVYPNPAKGELYVDYNGDNTDELGIYDLFGKKIYCSGIENEKIIIDLSEYKEGIYYVKIGGISKKVVLISTR